MVHSARMRCRFSRAAPPSMAQPPTRKYLDWHKTNVFVALSEISALANPVRTPDSVVDSDPAPVNTVACVASVPLVTDA